MTNIPRNPHGAALSECALNTALLRLNTRAWGSGLALLIGLGLFIATLLLAIKGGPVAAGHLGLLGIRLPGYQVMVLVGLICFACAFVIGSGFLLGRRGLRSRRPRSHLKLPLQVAPSVSELAPAPGEPARPAGAAPVWTDARWAATLTLLYFCIAAIGIAHHELWRDELQAWMLARDSGSIPELLQNMRYEGHPAAWHLLLFVLSRFTRDPVVMQVLHLGIATGVVFLLARYSPFSRPQKVLITFGYFFVYEYAVISRGYALGILALFGCLALFPYRRRSYLPLALLLALMANTSAFGLMLVLALGAALLFEWIWDDELRLSLRRRKAELTASIVIAGIAVAASLAQMAPSPLSGFSGDSPRSAQVVQLAQVGQLAPAGQLAPVEQISWREWTRPVRRTLDRVWSVYVPIPNLENPRWGTNLLNAFGPLQHLAVPFSVLLGVGILLLFARHRVALFLYVLGTAGMLFFLFHFHVDKVRHAGHLFVLFIACLWLANLPSQWRRTSTAEPRVRSAWASRFVLAILVAQLIAGATMWATDLRGTFSPAGEAAAWIAASGFGDLFVVATPMHRVSPVAAHLDREFYYPELGGLGSFVPWTEVHKERRAPEHVLQDLHDLLEIHGPELLLITLEPFPGNEELILEEVAHFPPGMERTETYHIYRVQRGPPSPSPGSPAAAEALTPPSRGEPLEP